MQAYGRMRYDRARGRAQVRHRQDGRGIKEWRHITIMM